MDLIRKSFGSERSFGSFGSFGHDPLAGLWKKPDVDEVGTMAALWKFDEGSGTSVADATGNGNTGTFAFGSGGANPVWSTDSEVSGSILDFTAANKSRIGYGTGIRPTGASGDLSMSCVLRPGTLSGSTKRIVLFNDYLTSGYYVAIHHTTNGLLTQIFNGSATNLIITHGTMGWSVDTWYHFTFVFNNSSENLQKVYLNGVEKGTASTSQTLAYSATEGVIGHYSDASFFNDSDYNLDGDLHWMAVWEEALSASQVSDLYDAVKP